ncbi:MAG: DUF2235 domain-containing protein [Gammaproteobacteria bacterium]|nr:DUF2235 domain-containing protein [Gammaproteobacteria bacterium]
MELGETNFNPAKQAEETPQEKKQAHVKVRLSVFFDGTLNNRINIDHRVANTAVYQQNKEEGNSYENDYTNVEKIERYMETTQDDEYDKKLSIYIEGPGTEDEKGDSAIGYGLGKGGTGIAAKVRQGILKSIERLSKHIEAESIIDKLTLDVMGFSRGAAGARNYIFEALKESGSIREGMEDIALPVKKIDIDFAGLFDTVASHGVIPLLLSLPNTRSLNLDAIREAKKIIHLVAAEEHRKNFSLTNIKSAGGNGQEFYLPGVHSDIGGGYRDEAAEDGVIYKTRRTEEATAERERLIAAGWYTANEITLKHIPPKIGLASVHLQVNRSAIQERIEAYITRIGSASAETDWQHLKRTPQWKMAKHPHKPKYPKSPKSPKTTGKRSRLFFTCFLTAPSTTAPILINA